MAAVTLLGSVLNTTTGTHTVTATPAANDLIVIVSANSGYTGTTTPTDNQGGTYVIVNHSVKATSADTLQVFVRTTRFSSAVSTIFSQAAASSTGGGMAVYKITGMSLFNINAVRQSAIQSNQAASSTPAPVFGSAVLTGNPVIGAVFNATSPATMTPRGTPAYTEDMDLGYSTPTAGLETMHISSGETATTITWGGTSASAFCSIAVEFDSTTPVLSSLVDTFDTSIDTTKWIDTSVFGGTVSVSSGKAVFTLAANTASTAPELDAVNNYNATGSQYAVNILQVASQNGQTVIKLLLDGNNALYFSTLGGNLLAKTQIGGSVVTQATIAYDATAMAFWRIRESGGTTFWDYASDGVTWTNLFSMSNPFAMTSLQPLLQSFDGSSDSAPGASWYDNVNTVPPLASSVSRLTLLGVG